MPEHCTMPGHCSPYTGLALRRVISSIRSRSTAFGCVWRRETPVVCAVCSQLGSTKSYTIPSVSQENTIISLPQMGKLRHRRSLVIDSRSYSKSASEPGLKLRNSTFPDKAQSMLPITVINSCKEKPPLEISTLETGASCQSSFLIHRGTVFLGEGGSWSVRIWESFHVAGSSQSPKRGSEFSHCRAAADFRALPVSFLTGETSGMESGYLHYIHQSLDKGGHKQHAGNPLLQELQPKPNA